MKKILLTIFILFLSNAYLPTTCAAPPKLPQVVPMSEYVQSISHVCEIVSDMKKSLNFYHDFLGFKILYDKMQNDSDMKLRNVVLMAPNHFKLELDQFYRPRSIKLKRHSIFMISYSYIGIEVKNLETVYKILKQHKVRTYTKPAIAKGTGYSFFFAKDPDGNYIEFFQNLSSTPGMMER